MGPSSICIGSDPLDPLANTCVVNNIFDGGFFDLKLTEGQIFSVFRHGISSSPAYGPNFYLMAVRLYQTPNLVEQATVITDYEPWGTSVGPENLVTNLANRSQRWDFPPLTDATGTTSTKSSCFRVLRSTITAIGPQYVLGLDFGVSKF